MPMTADKRAEMIRAHIRAAGTYADMALSEANAGPKRTPLVIYWIEQATKELKAALRLIAAAVTEAEGNT